MSVDSVLVVVCGLLGIPAALAIIGQTEAHRLDRPETWWVPWRTTSRRHSNRPRPRDIALLVATPLLFGAIPPVVPSGWVVPAYLMFVATALVLTVTDIDTKLIPNRILLRGGGLAGIALVIGGLADSEPTAVARAAGGAAAYFVVMLVLALLARGALGFGDVKLAALLGAFTGYLGWGHVLVAGIGSFLLAGVVAVVLLVFRLASRRDHIPYGPFMVAAAFAAVYLGDAIIEWYGR